MHNVTELAASLRTNFQHLPQEDRAAQFENQSLIAATLIEALEEVWPRVGQILREIQSDHSPETRRGKLRHLGTVWYAHGGEAEVLAELGIGLTQLLNMEPGVVLSELLLSYGAAQEENRTREWETHLLRRVSELDGLHRIISAANSTLELDTSMQTVVEIVARVVGVEVCSVYLYDKLRDELVLRATFGLNSAAVGQVVVRVGEGVTGWAAQVGQPVPVRDVRQEPRFTIEPQLGEELYHSMLAVPIVLFTAERFQVQATGQLQGVITVQTSGPREFTPEEISFVEVAAGELAPYIDNAQLYQQTDERLHQKIREMTSLQQVSKRIAEQLDLREVLNLIVEKAVELAHVDRADIFQANEDGQLQLVASQGGNGSDGVRDFIIQTVRGGRSLAVINAYQDSRFPQLASVAAAEGFHSLYCMPLNARERTIGGICLYTRDPHYFDYEQVHLLSIFADEAAIAIENARLYGESQRALAVKSAMLQEMHHRVRNNLQTIAALLAMQLRRLEPEGPGSRALRESAARIQSIAEVHNLLCREDVGVTTIDAIARQVVNSARISLVSNDRPVAFKVVGESVQIGSRDATMLALIINELISNSLVHGLAAEGGTIEIDTQCKDDIVLVDVRDDGPLHPAAPEPASSSGLGLQIIETLVHDDLGGKFELVKDPEWVHARISFPHRLSMD